MALGTRAGAAPLEQATAVAVTRRRLQRGFPVDLTSARVLFE
jgi:hypothetical protein